MLLPFFKGHVVDFSELQGKMAMIDQRRFRLLATSGQATFHLVPTLGFITMRHAKKKKKKDREKTPFLVGSSAFDHRSPRPCPIQYV